MEDATPSAPGLPEQSTCGWRRVSSMDVGNEGEELEQVRAEPDGMASEDAHSPGWDHYSDVEADCEDAGCSSRSGAEEEVCCDVMGTATGEGCDAAAATVYNDSYKCTQGDTTTVQGVCRAITVSSCEDGDERDCEDGASPYGDESDDVSDDIYNNNTTDEGTNDDDDDEDGVRQDEETESDSYACGLLDDELICFTDDSEDEDDIFYFIDNSDKSRSIVTISSKLVSDPEECEPQGATSLPNSNRSKSGVCGGCDSYSSNQYCISPELQAAGAGCSGMEAAGARSLLYDEHPTSATTATGDLCGYNCSSSANAHQMSLPPLSAHSSDVGPGEVCRRDYTHHVLNDLSAAAAEPLFGNDEIEGGEGKNTLNNRKGQSGGGAEKQGKLEMTRNNFSVKNNMYKVQKEEHVSMSLSMPAAPDVEQPSTSRGRSSHDRSLPEQSKSVHRDQALVQSTFTRGLSTQENALSDQGKTVCREKDRSAHYVQRTITESSTLPTRESSKRRSGSRAKNKARLCISMGLSSQRQYYQNPPVETSDEDEFFLHHRMYDDYSSRGHMHSNSATLPHKDLASGRDLNLGQMDSTPPDQAQFYNEVMGRQPDLMLDLPVEDLAGSLDTGASSNRAVIGAALLDEAAGGKSPTAELSLNPEPSADKEEGEMSLVIENETAASQNDQITCNPEPDLTEPPESSDVTQASAANQMEGPEQERQRTMTKTISVSAITDESFLMSECALEEPERSVRAASDTLPNNLSPHGARNKPTDPETKNVTTDANRPTMTGDKTPPHIPTTRNSTEYTCATLPRSFSHRSKQIRSMRDHGSLIARSPRVRNLAQDADSAEPVVSNVISAATLPKNFVVRRKQHNRNNHPDSSPVSANNSPQRGECSSRRNHDSMVQGANTVPRNFSVRRRHSRDRYSRSRSRDPSAESLAGEDHNGKPINCTPRVSCTLPKNFAVRQRQGTNHSVRSDAPSSLPSNVTSGETSKINNPERAARQHVTSVLSQEELYFPFTYSASLPKSFTHKHRKKRSSTGHVEEGHRQSWTGVMNVERSNTSTSYEHMRKWPHFATLSKRFRQRSQRSQGQMCRPNNEVGSILNMSGARSCSSLRDSCDCQCGCQNAPRRLSGSELVTGRGPGPVCGRRNNLAGLTCSCQCSSKSYEEICQKGCFIYNDLGSPRNGTEPSSSTLDRSGGEQQKNRRGSDPPQRQEDQSTDPPPGGSYSGQPYSHRCNDPQCQTCESGSPEGQTQRTCQQTSGVCPEAEASNPSGQTDTQGTSAQGAEGKVNHTTRCHHCDEHSQLHSEVESPHHCHCESSAGNSGQHPAGSNHHGNECKLRQREKSDKRPAAHCNDSLSQEHQGNHQKNGAESLSHTRQMDSVTHTPGNRDSVEHSPGNRDSVEHTPGNINRLPGTGSSSDTNKLPREQREVDTDTEGVSSLLDPVAMVIQATNESLASKARHARAAERATKRVPLECEKQLSVAVDQHGGRADPSSKVKGQSLTANEADGVCCQGNTQGSSRTVTETTTGERSRRHRSPDGASPRGRTVKQSHKSPQHQSHDQSGSDNRLLDKSQVMAQRVLGQRSQTSDLAKISSRENSVCQNERVHTDQCSIPESHPQTSDQESPRILHPVADGDSKVEDEHQANGQRHHSITRNSKKACQEASVTAETQHHQDAGTDRAVSKSHEKDRSPRKMSERADRKSTQPKVKDKQEQENVNNSEISCDQQRQYLDSRPSLEGAASTNKPQRSSGKQLKCQSDNQRSLSEKRDRSPGSSSSVSRRREVSPRPPHQKGQRSDVERSTPAGGSRASSPSVVTPGVSTSQQSLENQRLHEKGATNDDTRRGSSQQWNYSESPSHSPHHNAHSRSSTRRANDGEYDKNSRTEEAVVERRSVDRRNKRHRQENHGKACVYERSKVMEHATEEQHQPQQRCKSWAGQVSVQLNNHGSNHLNHVASTPSSSRGPCCVVDSNILNNQNATAIYYRQRHDSGGSGRHKTAHQREPVRHGKNSSGEQNRHRHSTSFDHINYRTQAFTASGVRLRQRSKVDALKYTREKLVMTLTSKSCDLLCAS